MKQVVSRSIPWTEAILPDGAPAVSIARLSAGPDSSYWVLVRFPAGWERAAAGRFEQEERFWVLEGAMEMNGQRHPAGSQVAVPAGLRRSATRTPDGCLVLACWSGFPRWLPVDGPGGPEAC